jgi:hypothetical protein
LVLPGLNTRFLIAYGVGWPGDGAHR